MNSLKYLSSQVDRALGQSSDEAGEELVPVATLADSVIYEEVDEDVEELKRPDAASPLERPTVGIWYWLASQPLALLRLFVLGSPTTNEKITPVATSVARNLQSPYSKPPSNSALAHIPQQLMPPRQLLRRLPPKTLVLDLDETLIHSLSQGAKFSANQMVEVRLGDMATLFYVNKRPYCDYFLQCVSEWFQLVIFTASVPAYADPMIDWLEKDRKYFARRYYRHHCTSTPEGYVKDLSTVEKDLSKVVIIDNSPVSYLNHGHNAIGIEGWISDPTDHSLLHLLPMLDALRHCLDVRSVVSLKSGEAAFE